MQEKASRRFWISLVLGFFAIDLTIAIVAISMAAGDPSFRAIPGFSQRSVHWGESQKKQRTLQQLGWQLSVDAAKTNASELAIRVIDRDGNVVPDLKLSVMLFHYTRVADQQKEELTHRDGLYVAPFDLAKPGLWHLDLEGVSADGKEIWTQITLEREA